MSTRVTPRGPTGQRNAVRDLLGRQELELSELPKSWAVPNVERVIISRTMRTISSALRQAVPEKDDTVVVVEGRLADMTRQDMDHA